MFPPAIISIILVISLALFSSATETEILEKLPTSVPLNQIHRYVDKHTDIVNLARRAGIKTKRASPNRQGVAIDRAAFTNAAPVNHLASGPSLNDLDPFSAEAFTPVDLGLAGSAGGGSAGSGGTGSFTYHNGNVIMNNVNIYIIYYGTWDAGSKALLEYFASNIGGTRWYNIVSHYSGQNNEYINNQVTFIGSKQPTDYGKPNNAYLGSTIEDKAIDQIVKDAISGGAFPSDVEGQYYVLTGADINETSGFCSQYCGWHDSFTVDNKVLKYAWVGNPDRCPKDCAFQNRASPNGNWQVDAMASIFAHEIIEATSNPDGGGYFDDKTYSEIADTCAWKFGTSKKGKDTGGNQFDWNVQFGEKQFLVQSIGLRNGTCVIRY